jgi:hypothetical protein
VFPLVAKSTTEACKQKSILVLNPVKPLSGDEEQALDSWIRGGGRILIACREDHFHLEAMQSYARTIGLKLEGISPLSYQGGDFTCQTEVEGRVRVLTGSRGSGKAVVVIGSEWWSRKRMGHCFDIPGRRARGAYRSVAQILEQFLEIAPTNRRVFNIIE